VLEDEGTAVVGKRRCLSTPRNMPEDALRSSETSVVIYLSIQHDIQEEGGTTIFRNVGRYLPVDTA